MKCSVYYLFLFVNIFQGPLLLCASHEVLHRVQSGRCAGHLSACPVVAFPSPRCVFPASQNPVLSAPTIIQGSEPTFQYYRRTADHPVEAYIFVHLTILFWKQTPKNGIA